MSSGIFNEYYYFKTTRKVIAAVGSMFTKMQIGRYDIDTGAELDRITVPLVLGQKEKYINRKNEDPNLTKPIKQNLPIMALEFLGLKYAPERKQQSTQYVQVFNHAQGALKQYVGVPYDLSFKLSILVRNIEDGIQLVEQILPKFTPDYTIRIAFSETMGITKDVPVTLENVGYTVNNDGAADDMRSVVWELDITAQVTYIGLITDPAIIKEVITNLYTNTQIAAPSTVLVVSSGGSGTFMDLETVYQGNAINQATASGTVKLWDPANFKLYITNISGQFSNTGNTNLVIGQDSNATWNLQSFYQASLPAVTIDVTPNPTTANTATDPHTWNIAINEYLG